jgi:outer membrane protein OmpA-like peptidoglycan-associated protein
MLDRRVPLELYEARNAVRIARWTGAKHYASETYEKAVQGLENAEGYLVGRAGKKPIGTVAREAVQMAEDARIITIKKMDEERLSNERQSAADRESLANTQRAAAQTETERVTRDADMARTASQAELERLKREADAQRAASQADVDRAGREKAEAESARAKSDAEADRLRREGDAQREHAAKEKAEAGAETEKARLALAESDRLREKAEAEKAELRAQLLQQFNLVLETRDTARGLIVNMSDVLFDTGKYSLRPGAREKLAKVSGIILGHPGLRLAVEGHTDNVGGDDYNQKLSEDRGTAVRDYLTHAGIPEISVTTKGFGKTQPVVSNDTAEGRQQNRRVEMVVSGEIIGGQIGSADRAK